MVISPVHIRQILSGYETKVWQSVLRQKKSLQWLIVCGIIETEMQSLLFAKPSAFLKLHFLIPHSDSSPTKALTYICSDSILITDIPGGQYWPGFDLIPPKGYSIYPRRQKRMSSQRSISLGGADVNPSVWPSILNTTCTGINMLNK